MEKKKVTKEDLKKYKAIDTMCRPHYVSEDSLRAMFKSFEFQAAAMTTFGAILARAGMFKESPRVMWRELLAKGTCGPLSEAWKAILKTRHIGSLKDALIEMDEIGVDYIFIDEMKQWSQHNQKLVDGYVEAEQIAGWSKESGGKIIGGASYNPLRIEESLKHVENAVKELGFKYVWIQPGSYNLRPDDKRFYPLYTKCLELDIPVCMQTGQAAEPLPTEPLHPVYADEIAINFPSLTIVLTHTGWPWVMEWVSMLWRHPNVYGNIGAYFPSFLDPTQVRFIDGPIRTKVLWATNGLGLTRCKEEFLELPIRDETRAKVLYENAKEVFRF
jgi:uncharacterized protein